MAVVIDGGSGAVGVAPELPPHIQQHVVVPAANVVVSSLLKAPSGMATAFAAMTKERMAVAM